MEDREHRKKRLTPEDKWQIFLEASRKNTTDAEVCWRWGIAPHQLRVIRERARDGAFDAFKRGPGRPKRDPERVELEQELTRTKGAQGARYREHPAAGKNRRRLIGPIRGTRLPAKIKRFIVGAVTDAKQGGTTITRSCEILMIDARRVRRWIQGHDAQHLTDQDLTDRTPVAKVAPHALTVLERKEILIAADDDTLAHLHHRKLTYFLSREN